jgi:formate-dependent nitrite reductase membrane component NrfD
VLFEIVSTRHNPLVDPGLHVWSWQIPIYLFLGGWVAGIMVLWGSFVLRERVPAHLGVALRLPLLGLALLSVGMLALFLDLEHKLHVWRLYVVFQPRSPMSWGAWILLLVYPVLIATAAVGRSARAAGRLLQDRRLLRALAVASIVGGVALGTYTGILLSALGARPLWNSALLGPLFLASGLSAAAAFGHLVTDDAGERQHLAHADNAFLTAELVLIGLLLLGLSSAGEAHAVAAGLLLGGPYTAVFWVIVVGLGIVVPLAIQAAVQWRRIEHAPIAPILVLLGGLALRFVIVYAGQHSHWP